MADIYDYIRELTKFEMEFEDNNCTYCLRSYIKRLEDDRILVDPPSFKGVTYNIPNGTNIRMIICAEDGVYQGESDVVGKELGSISGLYITYPCTSQRIQRREYLRVSLNLDVDMMITEDSSGENIREFKVVSRDVSGKGFSYISDEPLNNYFDIHCKIDLEDDTEPISIKCEHIYSHQAKINGKTRYINSFAFIDIEVKDIDRIVKECFKFQLELRKKGLL